MLRASKVHEQSEHEDDTSDNVSYMLGLPGLSDQRLNSKLEAGARIRLDAGLILQESFSCSILSPLIVPATPMRMTCYVIWYSIPEASCFMFLEMQVQAAGPLQGPPRQNYQASADQGMNLVSLRL
eukprot:1145544-Pelagomonas_calceolata.AAC.3